MNFWFYAGLKMNSFNKMYGQSFPRIIFYIACARLCARAFENTSLILDSSPTIEKMKLEVAQLQNKLKISNFTYIYITKIRNFEIE